MGMRKKMSTGSYAEGGKIGFSGYGPQEKVRIVTMPPDPQPDPFRYEVLREEAVGGMLVAELRYPDCPTYEGRKVLVFEGYASVSQVASRNGGAVDPHFQGNPRYASPVARLEPTDRGWREALKLAASWS